MDIIGYTPLGEDGQPYRPTLGRSRRSRRKPVTVYQSKERAASYSPVGKAKAVYIEESECKSTSPSFQ